MYFVALDFVPLVDISHHKTSATLAAIASEVYVMNGSWKMVAIVRRTVWKAVMVLFPWTSVSGVFAAKAITTGETARLAPPRSRWWDVTWHKREKKMTDLVDVRAKNDAYAKIILT